MDNRMPENMTEPMTIVEYLDLFCWTQIELARQAGVSPHSVSRAIYGEVIGRRTAIKIVEAIDRKLQSQGSKEHLKVSSIKGLRVAALQGKKPYSME
jgi:DNA transposition AAA+ family ATPase